MRFMATCENEKNFNFRFKYRMRTVNGKYERYSIDISSKIRSE